MSSRLIWIQDVTDKMVIGDLNGTNTYQLNSPKQLRVSWFLPTLFPIRLSKIIINLIDRNGRYKLQITN